jgi:hypothetical protein
MAKKKKKKKKSFHLLPKAVRVSWKAKPGRLTLAIPSNKMNTLPKCKSRKRDGVVKRKKKATE